MLPCKVMLLLAGVVARLHTLLLKELLLARVTWLQRKLRWDRLSMLLIRRSPGMGMLLLA